MDCPFAAGNVAEATVCEESGDADLSEGTDLATSMSTSTCADETALVDSRSVKLAPDLPAAVAAPIISFMNQAAAHMDSSMLIGAEVVEAQLSVVGSPAAASAPPSSSTSAARRWFLPMECRVSRTSLWTPHLRPRV